MPAIMARVIPTPCTVPMRFGGLMKFGGLPLGLGARGIVERSVPGGIARDIFLVLPGDKAANVLIR
jgi:hypothetical protein